MNVKDIDKQIDELRGKLQVVKGSPTVVYLPVKNGSTALCNWGKWRTVSESNNAQ